MSFKEKKCLQCSAITTNPKFCSMECSLLSDTRNNSLIEARKAANSFHRQKTECEYCHDMIGSGCIKKHKRFCVMHPDRIRYCLNCKIPLKSKYNTKTCSHTCSNNYFKRNRVHKVYKKQSGKVSPTLKIHRTICFENHEKKCVICNEHKIIAVHHLNEIHTDNRPENLIPMCPTHHQYWHSKHKHLIEDKVMSYITEWLLKRIN